MIDLRPFKKSLMNNNIRIKKTCDWCEVPIIYDDLNSVEYKNQMMNIIPETEETQIDDDLPFEIPGVEKTEKVIEEEVPEEEPVEEEIEEEKVEKKDNTKQSTLFSF
jgi:hypothetical protein